MKSISKASQVSTSPTVSSLPVEQIDSVDIISSVDPKRQAGMPLQAVELHRAGLSNERSGLNSGYINSHINLTN